MQTGTRTERFYRPRVGAAVIVLAAGLMGVIQAQASLIISVGSTTVAAGGSGFVDITLQNTSSTAFATPIFSFSAEFSTTNGFVQFTGATMSTAASYIYAGNSGDVATPLAFYSSTPKPNVFDFANTGTGTTIAGNTTLGLARINFNVLGNASSGSADISLTTDGSTSLSNVAGGSIAASLSNGSITINGTTAVPEPSTAVPLGLLLACVLAHRVTSRTSRPPASPEML